MWVSRGKLLARWVHCKGGLPLNKWKNLSRYAGVKIIQIKTFQCSWWVCFIKCQVMALLGLQVELMKRILTRVQWPVNKKPLICKFEWFVALICNSEPNMQAIQIIEALMSELQSERFWWVNCCGHANFEPVGKKLGCVTMNQKEALMSVCRNGIYSL